MNETLTRLLIVEDDLALQKQMCWAFDQYETIVAGDRESAMAMVRRHEPAVVTMDLGLPPHADDPTEGLRLLGHHGWRRHLSNAVHSGRQHDDGARGPERRHGVEDVPDQRPIRQTMHHFRQIGLHARALARGKDDRGKPR